MIFLEMHIGKCPAGNWIKYHLAWSYSPYSNNTPFLKLLKKFLSFSITSSTLKKSFLYFIISKGAKQTGIAGKVHSLHPSFLPLIFSFRWKMNIEYGYASPDEVRCGLDVHLRNVMLVWFLTLFFCYWWYYIWYNRICFSKLLWVWMLNM